MADQIAETEQDEAQVRKQWGVWIVDQLQAGQTAPAVTSSLVAQGWEAPEATAYVQQLAAAISSAHHNQQFQQSAQRRQLRDKHSKNMIYGGLWLVGGTVVTVGTMMAAEGGGRYVVTWGAIVFGGLQFLSGLVGYLKD